MIKFIQKHKIFLILLLSLITLLMGMFFARSNENATKQESSAQDFKVTYNYKAYWSNSYIEASNFTQKNTGAFKSMDGYKYNAAVGSVECLGFVAEYEVEDDSFNISDSSLGTINYTTDTSAGEAYCQLTCTTFFGTGTPWVLSTAYSIGTISGFQYFTNGDLVVESENNLGFWGGGGSKTVTFEVIFTPELYYTTFDANGGSFSDGAKTYEEAAFYLNYYDIPPSNPTRTGYTFSGWSYGSTTVTSKTYMTTTADHTVYAQWTPNNYTISFDKNGGTGGSDSLGVTYDSSVSSITVPKRDGYRFDGYYAGEVSNNGSGQQIFNANGNIVNGSGFYTNSSGNWVWSDNVTVYASWTKIQYNLTLNPNGGSGNNITSTTTVGAVAPTMSVHTRTGYTLTGYYTATSGGTKVYNANGTPVANVSNYTDSSSVWQKYSDTTLYAQWTANTYNLIFDLNGGSTSSTYPSTITYHSVPPNISPPTKTGYLFNGFYSTETNNNGSGSQIYTSSGTPNASITNYTDSNKKWIKNSNTTLYAQWDEIEYTIMFNPNCSGYTGSMASVKVTYNQSYIMPTCGYVRDGYVFRGWSLSTTGAETHKVGKDVVQLTPIHKGSITFYAIWELIWTKNQSTQPTIPAGSGSQSNPYQISSASELSWMAHTLSSSTTLGGCFIQTANINLNGTTWFPIGGENRKFIGSYDGNGYVITNLNTSNATDYNGNYLYSYTGLFGNVQGTVKNTIIYSGNIYGNTNAGAIAGIASQDSKIINCQSYANIYSTSIAGGIAGTATNATIEKCYVKANVLGSDQAGGIVGRATSTTISNCGFYGSTSGSTIVGRSTNTNTFITDCFAQSSSERPLYRGNATIDSCLYISGSTKGYTNGAFSNWVVSTTKTPLPSGLSWLAQGGVKATLADIQKWANS